MEAKSPQYTEDDIPLRRPGSRFSFRNFLEYLYYHLPDTSSYGVRDVEHWRRPDPQHGFPQRESLIFTVVSLAEGTNHAEPNSPMYYLEFFRGTRSTLAPIAGDALDEVIVLTQRDVANIALGEGSALFTKVSWASELPNFYDVFEIISLLHNAYPCYNILTRPCAWMVRSVCTILRQGYPENTVMEDYRADVGLLGKVLRLALGEPEPPHTFVLYCRCRRNFRAGLAGDRTDEI